LPGGLADVEDGRVRDSVLARADSACALPRLGGMARPDGVVVVSERFWAHAATDGSVREGTMPAVATSFRRVPLVRGLARIVASVSPLFRRTGVARRPERALLAAALLAPCAFFFLPDALSLVAGLALTAALVAWLLRGRTLFLHGAEHRAIAAAEQRRLVETWAGDARPSRFSLRCGTNFAVLVLPVAVLADWLWPLQPTLFTPVAVAVLSLALTMELWLVVQASQRPLARAFLLPGLALQRLTTREPTLDETRVALAAVASVLRRELDTP
jgi:uncharacterized protein YqhQ